ncbi:lycopene cyclase domain-containing protein [Homoserinimonas aerilata]|uniref:Lycopene cyclase domain-containing protein n=1 Tax=Homoserinimonas aerilata TaxID=1162970 RepID=A0A542YFI1_9MICO|nr:lycopene cyclase domain-containing protein [Homoserinimonas aerilata]TQL46724.1 lycopene cyclase domain-containing protein [Homoserinimonas aerilata]
MMDYWMLNFAFLGVVLIVVAAAVGVRRAPRWRAVGITAAAVLIMTAVFDNVMIAIGLFGYNPDRISGQFIGLAPLEDFAYAIAAVILLPCLWRLLERPRGVDA